MNIRYQLLSIIAVSYLVGFFVLGNWTNRLYYGDSSGYYLHVVSFFVNHDVGDYDKSISSLREVEPRAPDPREDKFGIRKTDKGRHYIKYTVGVGIMETPAFLIAHTVASLSKKYAANGWSRPYMLIINLGLIVYVLIGFNFLIKSLSTYFNNLTVSLTVLSIALATNLFYHSTYMTLAHGYLFCCQCLLIYGSIQFYRVPSMRRALGLGALVGLVTITRVPEIICALVPLLWGVYNKETFKKRWSFVLANPKYFVGAGLAFLLVCVPQISYWYYVSDQLVFNPYQGEGFNFLKPNIYNGWFHFSNGWLIYTPIMFFSLVGWFMLRGKRADARYAALAFVGLNAWIHYSYYIWNYYPGMGSRPMIEGYPLLAFALAAFIAVCLQRRVTKWAWILAMMFFTALNLFNTWQCHIGIIWTERGNSAFYWETFGKTQPSIQTLRAYDAKEEQPDTSQLVFIGTVHLDEFEDTSRDGVTQEFAFSGKSALFDPSEYPNCEVRYVLSELGVQPNDWLYFSTMAYRKNEDMSIDRDNLQNLAIEIHRGNGKRRKWAAIKIAAHIGNDDFSIWHPGTPDRWGEAGFFLQVPSRMKDDWTLRMFIWNPERKRLFIDDFRIDLYRSKRRADKG